ncbi:MAG: hypothetical protein K2Y22_05880 [Candidatus Obscuribacterales bacterium]|nr:hypothetical protein [Candidatus Obscuribacterales bacterium]
MSENQEQKSQPNNTKAGDAQNRQITVDGSMMVVQEVRIVQLKKGCNIIQAEGVPNNVDKSSIMCLTRSAKQGTIKSKSFRPAERMTAQRALDELKGCEVLVHYTTPFKLQTYNGIVVAGNSEELVLARPNGVTMIAKRPEAISATKTLRDVREMPALEFEIESSEDQEVDIAILFHAHQSLQCPISHNIIFDDKNKVITSLESNVLLSNNSGCDWSDVTMKVMTGQQEEDGLGGSARSMRPMMAAASFAADSYSLESAGGAEVESVGERKLLELPPGINLKNGDSKLIQSNLATDVPTLCEYYLNVGEYDNLPAQQKITFKNLACDKSTGMGKPIAAGSIKLYQRDKAGNLQLTHKQLQMPDVSVGEPVPLELGDVADIKATRRVTSQEDKFVDDNGKPLTKEALEKFQRAQASQTNRRIVQQNIVRSETFEVSIKNFKDEQVLVAVREVLGLGQSILKPSSFKSEESGKRVSTTVKVPARTKKGGGELKLTYVKETRFKQGYHVGDVDNK